MSCDLFTGVEKYLLARDKYPLCNFLNPAATSIVNNEIKYLNGNF